MAFAAPSVQAQNFTSGNLAVAVAAASSNNTTVSIAEINPGLTNQTTAVQTISIDGSLYRVSGSGTSTLYLANSADGSLLAFTAHKTNGTSANANTYLSRGVITLNNAKTISNPASYTGANGQQTRGASSLNNTNWFIGDQNGFYTDGSTNASPSNVNIRSVKAFGSTVYAFTSVTNAPPVGIISATSGGTYTGLSGLANGATSRQDFYLVSSGGNSTFDILYVLDATSATAGTIFKFSLVSGSWTANGSYSTTFGGFGLCADKKFTAAIMSSAYYKNGIYYQVTYY
ncbi:MAG: hypothetical protein EBT07_15520 [Actinobacteria bacterium]|nr:hypothetical protein [Actinomycetota bacterium]